MRIGRCSFRKLLLGTSVIAFSCGLGAADLPVTVFTGSTSPRDIIVFQGDRVIWELFGNGRTFRLAGLEGEFTSPPLRAPTDTFDFIYTQTGIFAYESWWVQDDPPHAPILPILWVRGVVQVIGPSGDRPEVFLNNPVPSAPFLIITNMSGDRVGPSVRSRPR
jgi:hypothetical protein